ncbi:histone acetyltransferase KAT6B-like [Haliotis rufescens]|uniref:histone acetyltransferase KAT6B-like n=1 Tax=Haliotis rufescens TaxID=6454 RepID=UPI001EB04E07|nr:histone acetyltransferase KAT6B-like [Haliotis rufescens]
MANPKYRDWILETIDQLRKRKARPDLERICHMVERKHGLSSRETEAQLEKLVDSEIVIKVDYKGNTSYRNGAKWKKSHLGGVVLNSSTASKRLHDAITELSHSQPTQNQETERFGISIRDIKNWLQSNFDDEVPLKSPINIVLQREIDAGRIEKLQNGNFSLPSSGHKVTRPKTLDVKQIAGTPSRRGRPPKNKNLGFKKPPKVRKSYGSEEEVVESVNASPPVLENRCDFCQLTAASNRRGRSEKLLICKDCIAKAHPSCMDYSVALARRARKIPWQCIDCKTCYICDDAGDPDLMLFCDGCDKGYHTNCHEPQVKEKPSGKWVCTECETDGVSAEALDSQEAAKAASKELSIKTDTETDKLCTSEPGPSFLHTPCDSPVENMEVDNHSYFKEEVKPVKKSTEPLPKEPCLVDSVYPDASDWTIDEVVLFFMSVGFEAQAEAFREQEIDGKSLLLMKRSDVLTGLSIKLGPALKIYRHVECLQTAGQDQTMH